MPSEAHIQIIVDFWIYNHGENVDHFVWFRRKSDPLSSDTYVIQVMLSVALPDPTTLIQVTLSEALLDPTILIDGDGERLWKTKPQLSTEQQSF